MYKTQYTHSLLIQDRYSGADRIIHFAFHPLTQKSFFFSLVSLFAPFRLSESYSHQTEQSKVLQQRMNDLKSSLSLAQQDLSQWVARYDSLMEQHQGLDLTMTKLDNHCEVNRSVHFSNKCVVCVGKRATVYTSFILHSTVIQL